MDAPSKRVSLQARKMPNNGNILDGGIGSLETGLISHMNGISGTGVLIEVNQNNPRETKLRMNIVIAPPKVLWEEYHEKAANSRKTDDRSEKSDERVRLWANISSTIIRHYDSTNN